MNKTGFSLVELILSIVVISCITAAFAPVITTKIKNQNISTGQNAINITTSTKAQDLNAILNILKDCKLNSSKTALICEIELSKTGLDDKNVKKELSKSIEQQTSQNIKTTEVKYSERRDKIRFDDKENRNYKTTTIVKNKDDNKKDVKEMMLEDYSQKDLEEAMEAIKKLYVPINGDTLLFDRLEIK